MIKHKLRTERCEHSQSLPAFVGERTWTIRSLHAENVPLAKAQNLIRTPLHKFRYSMVLLRTLMYGIGEDALDSSIQDILIHGLKPEYILLSVIIQPIYNLILKSSQASQPP